MNNNSMHMIKMSVVLSFFCLTFSGNALPNDKATPKKRYNEISYVATHNGQSHMGSPVQNQTLSLTQQFESGIRATKIHVWYDKDENGKVVPFVCHGVAKEVIDGSYFEKIIDKIPRIFQSWARSALKEFEPINTLFQDACKAAYGEGEANGVIQMRHCILDPSRKSLRSTLDEIKTFLDKNPRELITVILEDHTNNLDHISNDFKLSGLDVFAHTQHADQEWPMVGDMIDANKRLVVLLHGNEKLSYDQHPWIHDIWKFAWDTEFDFPDVASLKDPAKDIMPKRGAHAYQSRHTGAKNKLFIVHHFVTPVAGGTKDGAKKVNKKGFLKNRLDRLTKVAGRNPNIIQVDFFDAADKDVLEVVNGLNTKG
ncbi:MAG: hypothetical protein P4L31_03470 [Candidatus Babeliales bacterium]|nr:hypothetical protein [Candidatus Babeliales bacterium]